jgi:hypothetical protein
MAKRGYPPAIAPAIVFSMCTFVLLLMVTISTPMWNSVFFLKLISGPNEPTPLPSSKYLLSRACIGTYSCLQILR